MGEIADDMIDGACCHLCGQYFVGDDDEMVSHGYEVVCKDCWTDLTPAERKDSQKAKFNTM